VLRSTGAVAKRPATCVSAAARDRVTDCYLVGELDHQNVLVALGPLVPSSSRGPAGQAQVRRAYFTRSVVGVIVGAPGGNAVR
jgi:hypothetical protein